MAPAAGPADFPSYDLGMVISDVERTAAAFPLSPATSALRSSCCRNLRWDQYSDGPWDDPTFPPRFEYLRQFAVDEAGHSLAVTDLVPVLHQLLAHIESTES